MPIATTIYFTQISENAPDWIRVVNVGNKRGKVTVIAREPRGKAVWSDSKELAPFQAWTPPVDNVKEGASIEVQSDVPIAGERHCHVKKNTFDFPGAAPEYGTVGRKIFFPEVYSGRNVLPVPLMRYLSGSGFEEVIMTLFSLAFIFGFSIVPQGGAQARGKSEKKTIELELKIPDSANSILVVKKEAIDVANTAFVVIDMWDRHWCKTYTERVGNMVPRMNKTLSAARKLGVQIVFAPSDVMDFYKDYPQRKKMQAIPSQPLPEQIDFNPPAAPEGKNCCECGPTQPCRSNPFGHWSRQHPDLIITEDDLIGDCNNERELLNLCQQRGIDTLIYMGVASNMCVLDRQFGMLNMKRYGFEVIFVSDLVQAITANGLDPAKETPDLNFTPAKGSAIARRYLQRHIAPSLESKQLIAAAGMSPFALDKRPHIVFVIAEQEYSSNETLPEFAKKYLFKDFRCTFLHAKANQGEGRNDVPGLEAMYDADLLVLSMRRRTLPVVQMDHLEHYIRSGKPIVCIRVSVVPFQVKQSDRPDGHVIWHDFDKEVLGCNYQGYNSLSRETGCDVWVFDEAKDHPIMRGIDQGGFHSKSWLYRLNPLADTTTLLMKGRWSKDHPEEPVAFTNTFKGGRVFYTSLGHPDDFKKESFCKLLVNAVFWAIGKF